MTFFRKYYGLISLFFLSCDTGRLELVASLDNSLKESSGLEVIAGSKLFWTIEDAGNQANLYAINSKGHIAKNIDIKQANNEDWEDMTSDRKGHIYIGDFGNNSKKRNIFTIYKIPVSEQMGNEVLAEEIRFQLPKNVKSRDFEAFFLMDNHFYIFSKEEKSCLLAKVPNKLGSHTAEVLTDYNLKGKHNRITSAAISPNKKTIVLLNHDKLWKITNFTGDQFFKGNIEEVGFEHDSQKEGICFWDNETLFISDERHGSEGGNIYKFNLD